jgi:hypothetical protein
LVVEFSSLLSTPLSFFFFWWRYFGTAWAILTAVCRVFFWPVPLPDN